ncbi:MAG TPA: DUF6804 family protein [bacterium]
MAKQVEVNTKSSKTLNATSVVLRVFVIMAIILYIAARPYEDADYIGCRYVAFFGSVLLIFYSIWAKSKLWTVVFCAVAVIFFPVILIHINQYAWSFIAFFAAVVLGLSIKFLKNKKEPIVYGKNAKKPSAAAEAYPHPQHQQEKQPDAERPSREHVLWEQQLNPDVVNSVRNYLIFVLDQLRPTDWEVYALKAICRHSPALSYLLVNGKLDIEFIKNREAEGMRMAIDVIKEIPVYDGMTLRDFFHNAFEAMYKETSYGRGDKFCWYGRDRVIETLRSFQVSSKTIVPHNAKFYDIDGKELELDTTIDTDTIQKIKDSLEYFEKSREKHTEKDAVKGKYRFEIQSEYPVIEFDLEAIEKAGIFEYSGSLVNSLYEDLKQLLSVSADYTYLGYYAASDPRYDVLASSYGVLDGVLMLIKYKGAVEYFADRLYVEFQDIDQKSWVFQWLTCHKLHIEGND